MAIKNMIITICLIALYLTNSCTAAQVTEEKHFTLYSLEGLLVKVRVELDNVNNKIMVTLNSREILCVSGYRDLVQDVNVIDKKFIMLHYKTWGGSGTKVERFVLLCISGNHIYKSMDIASLNSYEFKDTYNRETDSLGLYDESGIYKLSIAKLQTTVKTNYQLIATEYEKVKSNQDANKNYETLDTLKFHFDDKDKVFYTGKKSLNGSYVFDGSLDKLRVFEGEQYPIIKLRNEEYLYVDRIWYNKVQENHLVKTSSNCDY